MAKIDFRNYAPDYIQYVKERPESVLKANTKDDRINMINNFIEYCDEKDLEIVTEEFYDSVDKIEQYFEDTSVHGVKISAIRAFLEYIGDQEDTKTDLEIEKIKDRITRKRLMEDDDTGEMKEEEIEEKLLSEEEINKAKKYMDKSTRLLVDLMYYTAVRPGEALALTPSDLDEKRQSLEVNGTWSDGKKKFDGDPIQDEAKHGSDRKIQIASTVFERLIDWIEENEIGENERVWQSYRSDVYRPIKEAFTKAEVKIDEENGKTHVTPHWFRHIGCTRLIDQNRKEDVQKHMGHNSIETTEHYEHVDRSEAVDVNVE